MRKLLSGAALLALTAGAPVFAADLAVKAPPNVPAPVFSWTGCFVGAHVGGAIREDRITGSLGKSASFDTGGFVGADKSAATISSRAAGSSVPKAGPRGPA
jgi:outer membrane immunogenic protein